MRIPVNRMWFEGKFPAFRTKPMIAGAVSLGLIAAALCIKLLFPSFPILTTLFPAILVSAWVGGAKFAIPTLIVSAIVGNYFLSNPLPAQTTSWQTITIVVFLLVGGLIIFVVDLLGTAVDRYQQERRRLDLALKAAKAALWESQPDRPLYWNKNYYDLIGLEYNEAAPPSEKFFEMVHPQDREKMREARRLMDSGLEPNAWDEFRLIRPDGKMLWLENHRIADPKQKGFYTGIVHDITSRKNAEEKIDLVLKELSHRIKNQYAVIIQIARDTYKQTSTASEFNLAFQGRMISLSRSNDLLLREDHAVDLKALLLAQIETFVDSGKIAIDGPPLTISPHAAQYFAIAFHELGTHAVKYGALSDGKGKVETSWSVSDGTFTLSWKEQGGPVPKTKSKPGFGTQVLEQLMPAAVEGSAKLLSTPDGIEWRLIAPAGHLGAASQELRQEVLLNGKRS
jgi:PAS domain S-box-containing protein